jgi:hypothetical protein
MNEARLHRMAHRLAYKFGRHECPEQLAQDLFQAACLAELEGKNMKPRDSMIEELSRWLWQCKRGRGKTRLLTAKVELWEWNRRALGTLDPEKILIIKEQLGREMFLDYQRRRNTANRFNERTEERRIYKRHYRRWVRAGRDPETDPRVRKGAHPKEVRIYKLTESRILKHGAQVFKKAFDAR